ncbi:MAG: triose-phosphate isomerase [Patescibacteria group bacterium]
MSTQKNQNKIIIGNWKMKKDLNESVDLAKDLKNKFKGFKKGEVAVCPDFVSLRSVKRNLSGSGIQLGAQDVFWEEAGSFTGEISPETLKQAGCKYVIIGHSERRKHLLENYSMIHQKIKAVLDVDGLVPVVCVGESIEDKKTDKRDYVILDQLQQSLGGVNIMKKQEVVVAYEPVWAIGSGMPIKPKEAKYAHKIIKLALNDMFGMAAINNNFKVIYGGSVNSKNVKDFTESDNLDGLLLGGASLDAEEFYKVANALL